MNVADCIMINFRAYIIEFHGLVETHGFTLHLFIFKNILFQSLFRAYIFYKRCDDMACALSDDNCFQT